MSKATGAETVSADQVKGSTVSLRRSSCTAIPLWILTKFLLLHCLEIRLQYWTRGDHLRQLSHSALIDAFMLVQHRVVDANKQTIAYVYGHADKARC
jgi:hypothetical protein